MKKFSRLEQIPHKTVEGELTDGCLVLEGGAWRGLYTQGVCDVLMEHGILMQTTIGVSAGAMSGISYVSNQVGRSARFNLSYRRNSNYTGYKAWKEEGSITGFDFFFDEIERVDPMNWDAYNDMNRRFVAVATDIETGEPVYFEKGKCEKFSKAIQASATVPYVSEPIELEGRKLLDGGISNKIPLDWALEEGFDKIIIVRTRDRNYRKEFKRPLYLIDAKYRKYPHIQYLLRNEVPKYNLLLDRIDDMEKSGKIFVIAPSEPVEVKRFEPDVQKLGELYELGRKDAENSIEALKKYLQK